MNNQKVFNFYPTLLNEYHRYTLNPCLENKEKLLNKINRIPETDPEVLKRFKKGISFEDAVLKNRYSDIKPELIAEAASLLPKKLKTQTFIQFIYKNIRFYGYADVTGENRVIDLKSTAHYVPGRHQCNFQNLYLYALRDYGFTQIEYIICDFTAIYREQYLLADYDFDVLLNEMEAFSFFVLENQELISYKKIITSMPDDLFT